MKERQAGSAQPPGEPSSVAGVRVGGMVGIHKDAKEALIWIHPISPVKVKSEGGANEACRSPDSQKRGALLQSLSDCK